MTFDNIKTILNDLWSKEVESGNTSADEEESVADIRKRTARYYESNEGVEPVLKRRKQLANDLLTSFH